MYTHGTSSGVVSRYVGDEREKEKNWGQRRARKRIKIRAVELLKRVLRSGGRRGRGRKRGLHWWNAFMALMFSIDIAFNLVPTIKALSATAAQATLIMSVNKGLSDELNKAVW